MLKANLASDAIISGVKKLASAVVEVGKASLEAYGDYEQLAGGAQLMFGDAYATVAENAKNAYKTVQMSQNDYLQQVNGFATGLKTALGGNEQAAADLAHKIVVAEADVVAATGNTQEAVQNAFNGIMKSNYTMLDNFQLGITPTKEGFQELIDKVNDWNAANGKSTSYTIDNLADCQSALVDYIEMQGLAGYASREAADTIQGSTASMKAAWENLSTGMADETADMEQLTQDFVDSVGTAAKNILPRVQQIVTGVGIATVEGISYLKETNEAIDFVVNGIENIGVAAAIIAAGFTLQKVITAFESAKTAVALLAFEVDGVTVAQMALNGTMTAWQAIVGVMTGQISLAALATEAWEVAQTKLNTAIAANPVGAFAILVAGLVASIKGAQKAGEKYMNQLKQTDGTVSGVIAKYNQLSTELAALEDEEAELGYLENEDMKRKMALEQACADLESQLADLTDAETAAAVASGEMSAKTLADAETLEVAAQTYSDAVQGILEDYLDTYQSIYDGIHDVGNAFTKVTEATSITWEKAMSNMAANTALLEGMDENFEYISKAASDARIDIDGFSGMLASMSTEDAAGLLASLRKELEKVGPTSGDAANTLQALSDSVGAYATSGQDYSQSLALIVEDVSQRISDATDDYSEAVSGLDQEAEAIEAGKNTMQGLASGIVNGTPDVLGKVDSLASQMKSKLQTSFSDFVLQIQANVTAKDGSHKSGLDYVPFDGYIAELHKGERVLTAEEASAYRAGKDSADGCGGGFTINQYIQTPVETPAELAAATEAYFQQARWAVAL